MNGKSLRMQKLLFAGWTTMGKMSLMLLHMVVHRILILLYLRTDSTDKLTGGIFLIDIRHL
jgi:hypothetical protein